VARRRFTFARGPYFNVVICALEIVVVVIVIVVVIVVVVVVVAVVTVSFVVLTQGIHVAFF